MKLQNKFKIGKNNISYISQYFRDWFYDMEIDTEKEIKYSWTLKRVMNDKEILSELKPKEVTLGAVLATLKNLKKEEGNLFYVRDKGDVLRAVVVIWYGGGWDVYAYSTSDPSRWVAGRRVFSAIPFETQELTLNTSDTLTLEKAIGICKEAGLVITKIY